MSMNPGLGTESTSQQGGNVLRSAIVRQLWVQKAALFLSRMACWRPGALPTLIDMRKDVTSRASSHDTKPDVRWQ